MVTLQGVWQCLSLTWQLPWSDHLGEFMPWCQHTWPMWWWWVLTVSMYLLSKHLLNRPPPDEHFHHQASLSGPRQVLPYLQIPWILYCQFFLYLLEIKSVCYWESMLLWQSVNNVPSSQNNFIWNLCQHLFGLDTHPPSLGHQRPYCCHSWAAHCKNSSRSALPRRAWRFCLPFCSLNHIIWHSDPSLGLKSLQGFVNLTQI